MLRARTGGLGVPVIVRATLVSALLAAGAVLLAGPAQAQDKGRPSDRALAPLVACRPIPDPRARAACYDAALDKLQQSVSERTVVVMDREQVKADFGFGGGPPLARSPAAKVAAPEPVQEVNSTIAGVISYGYDFWGIRVATGALWRTTDTGLVFPPKVGTAVQIKRGILGGYVMYIGKDKAVRVKRVR
jgi:hypothetical protein